MGNEALRSDPRHQILDVLRFLGLQPERYQFPDDTPEYPSFHVRSLLLQKTLRGLNRSFLERLLIKLRAGVRPTLVEGLALLNLSNKRTQPHPQVARALRLRYDDELMRLRELVSFDVPDGSDTGRKRRLDDVVPA